MNVEKYEDRLAASTAGGREGLTIWKQLMCTMSGEQKVAKSFELTEITRQIMRAGIREANPGVSEETIQRIFVERLLGFQGISLAELYRKEVGAIEPPPSNESPSSKSA